MKVFLDSADPEAVGRAHATRLLDGVEAALDMGARVAAPISTLWAATDGDVRTRRGRPRRTPIELSRDNLHLAQSVVEEMNAKGARELRASGRQGPEMAVLVRDCIRAVR